MEIKKGGLFTRGKLIMQPRPDINVDNLLNDVKVNFSEDRYEVYKTALIGSDIVIKKSGWTGLALKLKHKKDRTIVIFNPFMPSALARFFGMGLIPILILYYGRWKDLKEEFTDWASRSVLLNS